LNAEEKVRGGINQFVLDDEGTKKTFTTKGLKEPTHVHGKIFTRHTIDHHKET